MNQVTQKYGRSAAQSIAAAFAVGFVAVAAPRADAGDSVTSRWGNPCDTRDMCSSDPAKYAVFRENGPVKAREYVGEMRWGTGGAPDDVYIISRTVGSREFSGAKPCEVRDACINKEQSYQVVRVGPTVDEISTARKPDDVKMANQRIQK
jgi:hypothetical protein